MREEIAFTPVVSRRRQGGWTAARQRAFIAALQDGVSVRAAARCVGLSVQSAYKLRERPDADSFAAAWDLAMEMAEDDAAMVAHEQGVVGELRPIYYRGKLIGQRRVFNNRLLLALLKRRESRLDGDI